MAFTIDGTNGLTFNNSTTQNSGGKVLQVVQGNTTTSVSTTAGPVTTGLTASITPLFSTSKILVTANFGQISTTVNSNGLGFFVYKNGSNLQKVGQNILYITAGHSNFIASFALQYTDSPATTSSTTYAIYFSSEQSGTVIVQRDSVPSYITLMEIAA